MPFSANTAPEVRTQINILPFVPWRAAVFNADCTEVVSIASIPMIELPKGNRGLEV